jgi:threonine-phosphate decarboxylase
MAAEVLATVFPELMGYLDRTHDYLEREIPWLQCMLSLIPGIKIFPSEGNFILCRFDGGEMELGVSSAEELSIRLQLAGLLVPQLTRTSGLDDSESYFCISAQRRDKDQLLLETMKKIIAR